MCRNIELLLLDIEAFLLESFLDHQRCDGTEELSALACRNSDCKCDLVESILEGCACLSLLDLSLLDLFSLLLEDSCVCLVVDNSCTCREQVVSCITVLDCYDVAFFADMYDILVENNLHFSFLFFKSKKFSSIPMNGTPVRTIIFNPGINSPVRARITKSFMLPNSGKLRLIHTRSTVKPCTP